MNQSNAAYNLIGPGRFSLLAYAGGRGREPGGVRKAPAPAADATPFQRCVEEIRGFLVDYRRREEDQQRDFNEMLNKAVLGFVEERAKLLAIIGDEISRRRLEADLPDPRFETLAEAVFAEVIGLHVLELLLKDREDLEEIQVVGTQIYEVRQGRSMLSPFAFNNLQELKRIQQNLVLFNNDRINPRKRWAEVRLQDGSRVTMTGFGFTAEPTLTIRFYRVRHFHLQALAGEEYETLNEAMAALIKALLHACFNLVIIGSTNTGKTHFMKALIAELPDEERLITIESRFELMLKRDFPAKNIIEYEVDEEDAGHSSRQAFKLALRQSPKRICHAEIRDEDANIYVRACTRGHEGSMTSVHVGELEDVPDAITDMCMLDGRGMDPVRLTARICKYVTQIGIEMAVVAGRRKIVRIGEYSWQDGAVKVRDIVRYDPEGGRWTFPNKLSAQAAARIRKRNPAGYAELRCLELAE